MEGVPKDMKGDECRKQTGSSFFTLKRVKNMSEEKEQICISKMQGNKVSLYVWNEISERNHAKMLAN